MKSLPRQFINFKEYLVLLGCLLVSLILIFTNRNSPVKAIKIFTIDLIGSFQARLNFLSHYSTLEEQNKFLRSQNTMLALENSRMREAILENERLRKLIDFKEQAKFNLIAAKVIGGSSSGFMNYILLNMGTKYDIKKNMPLVLPEGLVGKIYHVEEKYSIGQLLFDQNFRVSAKIQRNSIKGIISWNGDQICNLNEIPNRSDIKTGDLVVTSGYSEIFPEGIYIGKVTSAINTPRDLFMKVKVKPDLDFTNLEEILVLTDNKSEE